MSAILKTKFLILFTSTVRVTTSFQFPRSAGINVAWVVSRFVVFQNCVLHGLQAGVQGEIPDRIQVLPRMVPARRGCRLSLP